MIKNFKKRKRMQKEAECGDSICNPSYEGGSDRIKICGLSGAKSTNTI
jgi:hypothetical protein